MAVLYLSKYHPSPCSDVCKSHWKTVLPSLSYWHLLLGFQIMMRINPAYVGKDILHLRNKIRLFDDQSPHNEQMPILTLVTFLLMRIKLLKAIETLSFHGSPQGM